MKRWRSFIELLDNILSCFAFLHLAQLLFLIDHTLDNHFDRVTNREGFFSRLNSIDEKNLPTKSVSIETV